MEIKDMNIGDIVYCKLSGNAARGLSGDDLIQEWEISKKGRKYITAKLKGRSSNWEVQFEIANNYKQNTNYCVDYNLYATKQEILDEFEKETIIRWFRDSFRGYGTLDISLDKLQKAKEILEN